MSQGRPYTKADEEAIRQEIADGFRKAAATTAVRYLGLPRRLRFRFWWQHRVNAAGIWLAGHGHWRAAMLLWRLFRMW